MTTNEYPYQDQVKDIVKVEREHGLEKSRQLYKYQGNLRLRQDQAMEIINILWGDAPLADKKAAAALCVSYRLNPLAGHVFLVPYKDRDTGEITWSRQIGIKATRLLASRRNPFSYDDMSPRIMSEEEQIKVWGKVDSQNICCITIVSDPKSGARAFGYGKWPKNENPKGTNKGNTKENMASIRSERQALDRLRPGEMPAIDDVVDEHYVEGQYQETAHVADVMAQAGKDIEELWPEREADALESQKKPVKEEKGSNPLDTTLEQANENLKKALPFVDGLYGRVKKEAVHDKPSDATIDWLKENLVRAFKTDGAIFSWLIYKKVKKEDTLENTLASATYEKRQELVREVEDRLKML